MIWLTYVSYFFGGIFLGNAIPHFVSGTMGRAFQSPFAHPSGKGLSSALVNIAWGAFNIVVGYVLVATTLLTWFMMYFINRRIEGSASVPATA